MVSKLRIIWKQTVARRRLNVQLLISTMLLVVAADIAAKCADQGVHLRVVGSTSTVCFHTIRTLETMHD